MRPYRFFFHYNKPASVAAGRPQITVHYRGQCHVCDNIVCHVPTEGHLRTDQPRFVMRGYATHLERSEGNIITLT